MSYGRRRPSILTGHKGKRLRKHPFSDRGGIRL